MDENDNKSEDEQLWEHMTRDVKPLPKNAPSFDADKPAPTSPKPPPPTASFTELPSRNPTPQRPPSSAPQQSTAIDHRTDERLRKGQMPIEGRLDMHGLTQAEAHSALSSFILNAHARGLRTLLVITGKGQKNRDPLAAHDGILKQRLPQWLAEPPLSSLILKTHPAKPKDGGAGAAYILLRRKR